MNNAIEIRELTKAYGARRGLTGLNLDVRTGEVFGYLGPNGAGKSTTIRLLLDLIRPTTGTATVLGLDPRTDGVAMRRRIGYLAGDFVVDGRQKSVNAYASWPTCAAASRNRASMSFPTASDSTPPPRSKASPKATARRSAWSRPSCTPPNC
ncbi:ATP-binding cassette domain-containing protein [Nocardia asteroides]|uniref:ABC transporter ATP binding protein n=1 Tax=Nocardia asteroides NBRC 15531 TaxID=1110697 RepID=U5E9E0_NOCAS|nr:ATP-binding cassette domain-containing protein [Nocardia asteroides]UGT50069.1 ATP-binding cassette domain-containing protein [Nocardia asteroides]GAD81774.1 putative ABC transporter ATP binding protein [Nocardia asteroides NBRC 15531]SFN21682.1 ABC transporter [Nocardia asteroides]VEG37165.1 Uncharacterized ABC transporter ATP-binding protein YbhF [Nocardia asteroides]